jgi:hypothetical protein
MEFPKYDHSSMMALLLAELRLPLASYGHLQRKGQRWTPASRLLQRDSAAITVNLHATAQPTTDAG